MGDRSNLENTTKGHNKFWIAEIHGRNADMVTVKWGKIGSIGKAKTYNFNSSSDADIFYKDSVNEKLNEGYTYADNIILEPIKSKEKKPKKNNNEAKPIKEVEAEYDELRKRQKA